MNRSSRQRFRDRFVPIVAGLVVLPAVGILGYRLIEGWSWLDATYMTVITLSTVGYTEVHALSTHGRLFTMGLIVSGGVLAAFSLTQLAQIFFSGEWRRYWETQKRGHMLSKLTDHMIVCGYGRVGRNVVSELRAENMPIVVIDKDPAKTELLQDAGVLAVLGDAADEANLKAAGIERARGLVAAAKSDAENVFIVMTARSLRAEMSIVARADVEESEPKLLRAGANRVILPYHITGRRLVTMLLRPDVADFLDEVTRASGMELVLEQVHVTPGCVLAGQTLAEAQSKHQFDVIVLGCKNLDGTWNYRPHGSTVVKADSELIALGTVEHLQRLAEVAKA